MRGDRETGHRLLHSLAIPGWSGFETSRENSIMHWGKCFTWGGFSFSPRSEKVEKRRGTEATVSRTPTEKDVSRECETQRLGLFQTLWDGSVCGSCAFTISSQMEATSGGEIEMEELMRMHLTSRLHIRLHSDERGKPLNEITSHILERSDGGFDGSRLPWQQHNQNLLTSSHSSSQLLVLFDLPLLSFL